MTGLPLARTGTPRSKPGGGLQRHAAHRVFVKMGLHFDDQRFRLVPFDHKRLLEPRQLRSCEGDVDHRAAHGDHLAQRVLGVRHRNSWSTNFRFFAYKSAPGSIKEAAIAIGQNAGTLASEICEAFAGGCFGITGLIALAPTIFIALD